jgi:hypothetical protein
LHDLPRVGVIHCSLLIFISFKDVKYTSPTGRSRFNQPIAYEAKAGFATGAVATPIPAQRAPRLTFAEGQPKASARGA